jgi:Amt family ammonium transporter
MSAAAGSISALLTSWLLFARPDLSLILNGTLAGLVAVTAPCAWVTPAGAVAIGLAAGILVVLAIPLLDRLRLDDPVGAIGVHLGGGVWGTLALGLFAAPPYAGVEGAPPAGLLYGGTGQLLLVQAKGVLVVGAFVLPAALVTWATIRALMGLRVEPAEEVAGLDKAEMGMEAYPAEALVSVGTLLDTSIGGRRAPALAGPASPFGPAFTVAFPTPAPAFAQAAAPKLRTGGNGGSAHDAREASPDGGNGGAGKPAPEANGKRFSVLVENVDRETLARRWRDLCRRPASEAPPEFQEVYPHVVSVSGNAFACAGGDPEAIRRALERIFQGGRAGTVARVVM